MTQLAVELSDIGNWLIRIEDVLRSLYRKGAGRGALPLMSPTAHRLQERELPLAQPA